MLSFLIIRVKYSIRVAFLLSLKTVCLSFYHATGMYKLLILMYVSLKILCFMYKIRILFVTEMRYLLYFIKKTPENLGNYLNLRWILLLTDTLFVSVKLFFDLEFRFRRRIKKKEHLKKTLHIIITIIIISLITITNTLNR